ncbi:hypothetical protein HYX58_02965 [Candidatus Dependentiae bacterium]|nr:hypothetical protein [Candidatus Dependentiae bacterium]
MSDNLTRLKIAQYVDDLTVNVEENITIGDIGSLLLVVMLARIFVFSMG